MNDLCGHCTHGPEPFCLTLDRLLFTQSPTLPLGDVHWATGHTLPACQPTEKQERSFHLTPRVLVYLYTSAIQRAWHIMPLNSTETLLASVRAAMVKLWCAAQAEIWLQSQVVPLSEHHHVQRAIAPAEFPYLITTRWKYSDICSILLFCRRLPIPLRAFPHVPHHLRQGAWHVVNGFLYTCAIFPPHCVFLSKKKANILNEA